MSKNKLAFLKAGFFQPIRAFESFLNCSDWLDESQPSEKGTSFMDK